MKERPILFSTPMVQAILAGRKSQTRRAVKPSVDWCDTPLEYVNVPGCWTCHEGCSGRKCPYGVPGDRLWVRETWRKSYNAECRDNTGIGGPIVGPEYEYAADYRGEMTQTRGAWRPSIHMPSWASRITLEVTGVRVERVQSINEYDAIAEGCAPSTGVAYREHWTMAVSHFASIWNELNAERGFGWDANPWVWVISFKVIPR